MAEKRLIVLGGGPAGYVGAIRAGKLGLKVTLIERDKVGGTCLNRGCIPSKALLHAGRIWAETQTLFPDRFNAKGDLSRDWTAIRKRKEDAIAGLRQGIQSLLRASKVELVQGVGRVVSPREVSVKTSEGEKTLQADALLIATGSEPARPGPFKIEHPSLVTSTEALDLQGVPGSVLVIGAGAVGIELSRFYASFGIPVTLVEMMDRCLPGADPEISKLIEASLTSRKITCLTGRKVLDVQPGPKGVVLKLDDGKELRADLCLVAAGRSLNTRGIGLAEIGVKTKDPGGIVQVSPSLETSVPGVYAAGDITGGWMLAHKASAEALVAVQAIQGPCRPIRYDTVPACVYGDPEVASVGATEEDLKRKGVRHVVGRYKFGHLGRARAEGRTEGLFKVLADPDTGEIFGVHVVGEAAPELIHEACIAIGLEATAEELMAVIHAHPSFAEGLWEATGAAFGRAIHG